MSQNRGNSKIKINAIPTNDKHNLKKEINDKKLLINNEKYLKDYLSVGIKINDPKPKGKKPSTSVTAKNRNNKPVKAVKLPSSNTTIQNIQSTNSFEISKSKIEPVHSTMSKIEKIYNETLNRLQSMKVDKINNNIFDEELLKEEILFLKQKNEILKLKSDFYELIFYSFRNLIDASNPNNNMSEINVETITAEELKNKLLCIFTQNNQYFYDNLNFFHKDKSKDFLFAFDESVNHEGELINKRCLDSIVNIEKNIHVIIQNINSFIKDFTENNNDSTLYSLKQNLLSCSKEIMSYYLLSENMYFDFNMKNKFLMENSEAVKSHEISERKNKFKKDFNSIIEPLVNKIISKKNKTELANFVSNTVNFYENNQLSLLSENYLLKSFNTNMLDKLTKSKEKIIKIINDFISQSKETISKLNDIINYHISNQGKNNEKVIMSLINTEKDNYMQLINNFNTLNEKISKIK